MHRITLIASLMAASPVFASEVPKGIDCYQTATNTRDIDAYMACFTHDAVMIDASRTFEGKEAIRT